MESPLVYQGIERREMLRFMRRLCLTEKEALLERLCTAEIDTKATVERWFDTIRHRLEDSIRATGIRDGREAMMMPLFADSAGVLKALSASFPTLCRAWQLDQESKLESVLWNTLSQFFKRKMDELDGYGAGHGTHVLQARRRIDKMAKELADRRAHGPNGQDCYRSLAELAADLSIEVRRRGLEKQLPATPTKILEYLYESEAASTVTEDPWDDRLILGDIVSSDVLIQLEQCIEMLPETLRQAISIKFGLADEPAFINDDGYRQYYGVGREAMRKRTTKARSLLLECIFGEVQRGSVKKQ